MPLNLQDHYANRAYHIANKTYHCRECSKSFRDDYALARHRNGLKHRPDRVLSYNCECCPYNTKNRSYMKLHLKSKKHYRNAMKQVIEELRTNNL
jgi:hypothetical protein